MLTEALIKTLLTLGLINSPDEIVVKDYNESQLKKIIEIHEKFRHHERDYLLIDKEFKNIVVLDEIVEKY